MMSSPDGRPTERPAPICRLCGGRGAPRYTDCRDLEYFIPARFDFHRCAACGLVFMHPLPTREELPHLYPPTYHNFDAPVGALSRTLLDRYYAHHAAICRRYLPKDGAFLEIGSAGGDLLERLRAQGYRNVQGVELSRDGWELSRRKGLTVFHGTAEEFATDDRFDLVFMSHVIEHVLDPVDTVLRMAALLKEGGVLYVETPNVASLDARIWRRHWGLIHYPRHLYLFDRRTIRRLLSRGGLIVERTWSELNSCGWALSVQCALRRLGLDPSRRPRSFYYPALLVASLPLNLVDLCAGGTAFMATVARKARAVPA
jgi:2-polyprenyl-3-methyl-5-hydroxy-6-metoxy-1,4-benzoquinol methylase